VAVEAKEIGILAATGKQVTNPILVTLNSTADIEVLHTINLLVVCLNPGMVPQHACRRRGSEEAKRWQASSLEVSKLLRLLGW